MKSGLFREDLYYRLNIIKIETPPLRERRQDVPMLTEHFIQKYQNDLRQDEPFRLNGDMEKLFQLYHWPGNVRELSSTILSLMVGDDPERVRFELLNNMEADGISPPPEIIPASLREETPGPKGGGVLENELRPLKVVKAEASRYIERKAIMHALEMTGWNKREAAKVLKISYKALFYKMANAGIKRKVTL